jgi:hypothetical protein
MSAFPFIGSSYTARSKSFDSQRAVNLYVEMSQSGPGPSKSIAALIGTPGLALWSTLAGGAVRGAIRFSSAVAVVVVGANVYTVTTAGVGTLIGAIGDGTTPVSMASNGTVVAVATGIALFAVNPTLGTVAVMPGYAADRVDFIDGYFVFNETGTGRFRITGLYATTIDVLAFATAEGSPDNLISLIVDHRELWLFGQSSTEVWFNSGNADFPFERIQGAFIEQGCAASFSVAKMDNTVFWLTADDRGQGTVQKATGYQPQRISTHALEFAIASYSRIDDAVAYTYQQEGHSFYVLSFPTGNATWVYDASTGLWHERAWRNPTDASLNRHRAQCHMAFAGKNLVGDWETGNIYRLDLDTFTDNGAVLPRVRACSHLSADLHWQFFTALQIDMEAGVGLTTGQGSDPKAMLQWSDDGGYTWGPEVWASIGKLGEKRTRVRWRRLGKSRDRVFRVTITDPIKVVMVGASVDVVAGAT